MQILFRISFFILLSFTLTGCVLFYGYTPKVQQGNVLPASKVALLRHGLSQQQVLDLLGSPVYTNTFGRKWVYVYTYQKYPNPIKIKRLIVTFHNNRISDIERSNTLN